jgi:hypothetical protein
VTEPHRIKDVPGTAQHGGQVTDEPTLTIEDVPLETVRHILALGHFHVLTPLFGPFRKALEKYEAESKPYYVAETAGSWEVFHRKPGLPPHLERGDWKASFPRNAEAAARKHAAELNGETTEPEKWWVTEPGGKKKAGPFESASLAATMRAFIEIAENRTDFWIKFDSELKEGK